MKRYIGLIIAVVLILAGLIGGLICVFPGHTAQYKVINKYINAVDDCDFEALKKCLPLEELSSSTGMNLGELLTAQLPDDLTDRKAFLNGMGLSVSSQIPETAQSVESVKLVSCTADDVARDSWTNLTLHRYRVTLSATYIAEDGSKVTVTGLDTVSLIETQNGFKVIG